MIRSHNFPMSRARYFLMVTLVLAILTSLALLLPQRGAASKLGSISQRSQKTTPHRGTHTLPPSAYETLHSDNRVLEGTVTKTTSSVGTATIYAPYWKLGSGFESTLLINNVQPRPIMLQPLVYTADGELLPALPISMGRLESKQISLRDVIEKHVGDGQIGFSFVGMSMDIVAQIIITNKGQRLSFNHVFMAPMGKTTSLEGVAYFPQPASTIEIALANISAQPIEAQLAFSIGALTVEELSVRLPSHATKTVVGLAGISGRIKGSAAIGVRVTYTGMPGDLVMQGMVSKPRGYSTNIRYIDPSGLKSNRLITPIASLQEGSPMLVAKNISADSVELKPEAHYTLVGQHHNFSFAPRILAAREVRAFEMSQEFRSQLPPMATNISLELTSSRSASVVADLLLLDGANFKALQLTPKDSVEESSPAYGYPWRVGPGVDTVFALTNPSQSEPVKYSLFIYYGGGKVYSHREHKLNPGESRHISVRDLIVNKIPDDLGAVLPAEAAFGQAKALVSGVINKDVRLIGEAVLLDENIGVAAMLSCPTCPPDPDQLLPTLSVVTGDADDTLSDTFILFYTDNTFESNPEVQVLTDDLSVATYNHGFYLVELIGAGFTDLHASTLGLCAWSNDGETCHCDIPITKTATIYVTTRPKITSISPPEDVVGLTSNITIQGRGFAGGASVNAGSGITISNVAVSSTTNITADFNIAEDAAEGNRSVTVTAKGVTSTPINFYAQVPRSFRAISVTQTDLGCDPNTAGVGVLVVYEVRDQRGVAIKRAGMTPQEHVTVNGTDTFPGFRPFAAPQTTDSSGRLNDMPVGSCFGPPPPSTNFCVDVVQTFNVIVGSKTHAINTTTTRRDCVQGIRVTSPPVAAVTIGTVN